VQTRGAGTVVELSGKGPLASLPRFKVSPSPSCPAPPQHLTVASSCGEKQPRVTDQLRTERWVFHPKASGALR